MPRGPVGRAPEAAQLLELIQRVASGQESGLTELYDATSSRVYGAVLHILRSPHLAAEVAQEVYVEIWRQASCYEPGKGSVLAWIMTIAHGRAVDRARASHERYARQNGDREFDRLSEEIESRLDADPARDALRSLPEMERQAVTLVYFDGYSQTEVARILGVPLGTVKSRIRDGLIGLRNALGVGT